MPEDFVWGTNWVLIRAAPVDPTAVHVTRGFKHGRAGGRAPANRYFGMYEDLGAGAVRMGPFGVTRMAGPPSAMAAEEGRMRMLEAVRGLRVPDGELVLAEASGAELLVFKPGPS